MSAAPNTESAAVRRLTVTDIGRMYADGERIAHRPQHVVAAQNEKKVAEGPRQRGKLVLFRAQDAGEETSHAL